MNEKPVKVDIDFNEALKRIAKTPKSAVVNSSGVVDEKTGSAYNEEAEETNGNPPPSKVKPDSA